MSGKRTLLYLAPATLGFLALTPHLHAQTLTGPDGCTAAPSVYGSGNFAGGSLSASCPSGSHKIVVSVTISAAEGGASQSNTCNATTECSVEAGGTAYGTVHATFTWSVDGIAGETGSLSLQ